MKPSFSAGQPWEAEFHIRIHVVLDSLCTDLMTVDRHLIVNAEWIIRKHEAFRGHEACVYL